MNIDNIRIIPFFPSIEKAKRISISFLLPSLILAYTTFYIFAIRESFPYLQSVAYSQDPKPFVFRALLPLLSRAIEWIFGLPAVYGLILLAILSSVGLFFSIRYLCLSFWEDGPIVSLASFFVAEFFLFVIASKYPKIYDISTGLLFALSIAFLARGKLLAYFLLFPIVTLNRETSFLLTFVFIVYYFRPSSRLLIYGSAYQALVYCLIRLIVSTAFFDRPGSFLTWRPIENILGYADHPIRSIVSAIIILIILFSIFRGWDSKPVLLRSAFLALFPAQVVLYITMGFPLEFRAFAESLPVALLLMVNHVALLRK